MAEKVVRVLGEAYLADGGPRSLAGALELFEKAADKENSGAMFALGALNSGGHNLPVDRPVAERWFRATAERGHAQMMLGRYLVKGVAGELNPVEGRLWLEPAIAQGIAEAEPDLAAFPNLTYQCHNQREVRK
jgi:TPR repeat protein